VISWFQSLLFFYRYAKAEAFYQTLKRERFDQMGLSPRDLLRRDYKQWDMGGWRVGVASYQVPLHLMGPAAEVAAACDAFSAERGLDLLVLMPSFDDAANAGAFTRQLAFVPGAGAGPGPGPGAGTGAGAVGSGGGAGGAGGGAVGSGSGGGAGAGGGAGGGVGGALPGLIEALAPGVGGLTAAAEVEGALAATAFYIGDPKASRKKIQPLLLEYLTRETVAKSNEVA
jgi:hypothetical protein